MFYFLLFLLFAGAAAQCGCLDTNNQCLSSASQCGGVQLLDNDDTCVTTCLSPVSFEDGCAGAAGPCVCPAARCENKVDTMNGCVTAGQSELFPVRSPFLGINYIIALVGVFPFGSRKRAFSGIFNDNGPFIGEIRQVGFDFAPRGWAFCNGQLLAISSNTELFAVLGTNYGGDGRTTFGLPDLRGRAPVVAGGSFPLGQKSGSEQATSSHVMFHDHGDNTESAGSDSAPIATTQPSLAVTLLVDLISGELVWFGGSFAIRGTALATSTNVPGHTAIPAGSTLYGVGSGPGLTSRTRGQDITAAVVMTDDVLASHNHAHGTRANFGSSTAFSILDAGRVIEWGVVTTGVFPSRSLHLNSSKASDPRLFDAQLAEKMLPKLVAEGENRWRAAGVNVDALARTEYEFRALEGVGRIGGVEAPNVVTLDPACAGSHWFIDTTPGDDSNDVIDGIDMLTVVMHEQGHILGFSHVSERDVLMSRSLSAGVRHNPRSENELRDSNDEATGHYLLLDVRDLLIGTLVSATDMIDFENSDATVTGDLVLPADGRLLQISQNAALFALFGTFYGGDGRTTFGLPDLRSRVPVHSGISPGLALIRPGQRGGSETVTPTINNMASHTHSCCVCADPCRLPDSSCIPTTGLTRGSARHSSLCVSPPTACPAKEFAACDNSCLCEGEARRDGGDCADVSVTNTCSVGNDNRMKMQVDGATLLFDMTHLQSPITPQVVAVVQEGAATPNFLGVYDVLHSDIKATGSVFFWLRGSLRCAPLSTCGNLQIDWDLAGEPCQADFVVSGSNRKRQATPGPIPSANIAAGAEGDPHLHGAHGEKFDFFGIDNAIYNLFSTSEFVVNILLGKEAKNHFIKHVGVCFRGKCQQFDLVGQRAPNTYIKQVNNKFATVGGGARFPQKTQAIIELDLCQGHRVVLMKKATVRGKRVFYFDVEIEVPGCHNDFDGALGQTYKCKYAQHKQKFVFDKSMEESFRVKSLTSPFGLYNGTLATPCISIELFNTQEGKSISGHARH